MPETDTFKLSRFHVAKNNVRPKWFFGREGTGADCADDDGRFLNLPVGNQFYIPKDMCSFQQIYIWFIKAVCNYAKFYRLM